MTKSIILYSSFIILNYLISSCCHASPPFILPSDAPILSASSSSTANDDTNNNKSMNDLDNSSRCRSRAFNLKSNKEDDSSSIISSTLASSNASSTSSSSNRTSIKDDNSNDNKNTKSNKVKLSSSSSSTTTTTKSTSNTSSTTTTSTISTKRPIKVCYQGEPGAYSEKSLRELLGHNVIAVARPTFEACYQAVASKECDYACLPFENSLGGSIHDNYDLMLRYDLTIVAEHEFRVKHCLLVVDGVKKDDIKFCMSHPQALAQCDNYLRSLGITPIPMYDTAGSAKMLMQNWKAARNKKQNNDNNSNSGGDNDNFRALPDQCTPENTAAIASDLAGVAYGLHCLDEGIEDDDTNFTRFLLLGREGVSHHLNKNIPSKTSIVFTLPNTPGALYKALACFSLREIDFSKIESRPTSASLLNFLKFKNQALGNKAKNQKDLPRFRYCFYLDFLASELDENAQNAIHHLKELAEFGKVLGSYPQKSKLVGPVLDQVEASKAFTVKSRDDVTMLNLPSDDDVNGDGLKLNVGIIGYGSFGQFLGKKFAESHKVKCIDHVDKVCVKACGLFCCNMKYFIFSQFFCLLFFINSNSLLMLKRMELNITQSLK